MQQCSAKGKEREATTEPSVLDSDRNANPDISMVPTKTPIKHCYI